MGRPSQMERLQCEVTLDPGESLEIGVSANPTLTQIGIYLLDTCPEGSWVDDDNSGACGSNEYIRASCSLIGCDPVNYSYTSPTERNGEQIFSPTTYWLVVDTLGATEGTDYQLDWRKVAAAGAPTDVCTGAPDLETASRPITGSAFTHRLGGIFGDTDDYNPLSTEGLPPSCIGASPSADGNEVVAEVTLDPGETLELRISTTPDLGRAAMYLLDTCPEGSWPDDDGSGACGSNEYQQASCSIIQCDPMNFSYTAPTERDGQPVTTPTTYWLVIDSVGSADSYQIDWRTVAPAP